MMQANQMMPENQMMQGYPAMHGCPMMMGGAGTAMMIGMWIIWLLTLVLLLLGIAALVKYLRSGSGPRAD
jgi:tetrahydromethanopterin S-methyltransferase subunit B